MDHPCHSVSSCKGAVQIRRVADVTLQHQQPLRYWDIDVSGSPLLIEAMQRHQCRALVFITTATVYGEPEHFPITEEFPTNQLHPYAQTKLADK